MIFALSPESLVEGGCSIECFFGYWSTDRMACVHRCGLKGGTNRVPGGAVSGRAPLVEAITDVPYLWASCRGNPKPSYQLG